MFIPIFIAVNTITCGLSIIMAVTGSVIYAVFLGLMWIFGLYISLLFRKCKLNFFADLTLFILLMNFIEVLNVSIITGTMWLCGHYNLSKLNLDVFTHTNGGNAIPDDYYFYTLSAWILYIILFIELYKFIHVIYELVGCKYNSVCCDVFSYILTYPLAIFIGVGMYISPLLVSLVVISGLMNLWVFAGILGRIFEKNMKEVCIILLLIVVAAIVCFIVFAAF